MNAKELCKRWNLKVKHQLYRKDGTWYHLLTVFPGALLDESGYMLFETEHGYLNCPGLIIGKNKEKNWANCPNGISTLSGYIRMIENYELVPLAEELHDKTYPEGASKKIIVNAYERNPKARAECIKIHGTRCAVCDFDFGKFYGSHGEGFIHVHHLKSLSKIDGSYKVNPKTDLRPVCPNCHAMLHRNKEALSIEQLKELIQKASNSS